MEGKAGFHRVPHPTSGLGFFSPISLILTLLDTNKEGLNKSSQTIQTLKCLHGNRFIDRGQRLIGL